DASQFEGKLLVDYGLTGKDSFRKRYNGMINVPLVEDKLAFRAVGFYRHEDGWVDNIGTGRDNANTLESAGGRAMLQWDPTDRLSMRAMVMHENSKPRDSGLVNPDRGEFVRLSERPDLFHAKLTSYNFTLDYDLGFANLTTSSTLSTFDQTFIVALGVTFAQTSPFALDALAYDDIFVQEVRLASAGGGRFDWIVGGFFYDKRRDVDYNYRSSIEFLEERGLTGLDDEYYQRFGGHTNQTEMAGFGELTYRFSDNFWLTGGLRYTTTKVQSFTEDWGYNSNYLALALGGFEDMPITVVPIAAAEGLKVKANKVSYKASASYKPSDSLTAYATVATGFRSPVVNARAGLGSVADPTDIIIPDGADSDSLTNYEVGLKGNWLGGALTAAVALYYIDWRDI